MAKARGNGFAQFSSCATGSYCAGSLANAQFEAEFSRDDTGEDAGPPPCTTTVAGECEFVSCTAYPASTPGVPAGTLTIAGGTMGTVKIRTDSIQDFVYSFSDAAAGFSAGDTLSVTGSGGRVPAFATQSIVAPALVTLTSPVADAKGEFEITSSSALKVTWTGGVSGETVYVQGGPNALAGYEYFACGWDAAAGKGSVPASILAAVANGKGSFAWGNQGATETFSAGGYTVDYSVSVSGAGKAKFE
jgi:hypothetical protein